MATNAAPNDPRDQTPNEAPKEPETYLVDGELMLRRALDIVLENNLSGEMFGEGHPMYSAPTTIKTQVILDYASTAFAIIQKDPKYQEHLANYNKMLKEIQHDGGQ